LEDQIPDKMRPTAAIRRANGRSIAATDLPPVAAICLAATAARFVARPAQGDGVYLITRLSIPEKAQRKSGCMARRHRDEC